MRLLYIKIIKGYKNPIKIEVSNPHICISLSERLCNAIVNMAINIAPLRDSCLSRVYVYVTISDSLLMMFNYYPSSFEYEVVVSFPILIVCGCIYTSRYKSQEAVTGLK